MKADEAAPIRPDAIGPFRVFSWLWAAAVLGHMSSYSEPVQPVTVAMVALAFAVLFGVSRVLAFFLLLIAHLLYVYGRLPHVPNHSILAASIDLTILTAAAWSAVSQRTWTLDTTALYKSFAPVIRIELLVLYFFVVFHKLNSGFFHPEQSCTVVMYLRLAREWPFLPVADWWVRSWMIYLTLFIEAAIPIMLVARGLRLAGLIIAFGFHFALAMDPGDVVFNFSSMLLALFFLFLPDDFSHHVSSTLAPLRRWWDAASAPGPGWLAGRLFAYVCVPLLMPALIFRDAIDTGMTHEASRLGWVVYAGFVFAVFLRTLQRSQPRLQSARQLLTSPSPMLLIFPALLFANGLLPYLGGKTETSFAMYSNLRTEGGVSNHWLVPPTLQVWGYQRDLVKVRRTSVGRIQRLANRGFQWTYFEFKAMMSEFPNASVTYERNGIVRSLRRVKDDPEFFRAEESLMRKMLKFRPIAIDEARSPCIH